MSTSHSSTARLSRWTWEHIAAAAGGALARDGARPPTRVGSDSRAVAPGELFVALVGERFDGHDFVAQAVEQGAAGVIISDALRAPAGDAAVIVVKDTLRALQHLGHAVWREAHAEGARTIALTGSNGKTTTKELLRALWQTQGVAYATRGNLNNHIGVPLTLTNLPDDAQTIIVEMGANQPPDIRELTVMAPGHARLITSIGAAHLEGLGSLDGVRRTKGDIVRTACDAGTLAVVPHSERARLVDEGFPGRVLTFGEEAGADVRVLDAALTDARGMRVGLDVCGEQMVLHVPLFGRHNATNLAAAVATFIGLDVALDPEAADAALAALELPGGRWRREVVGDLLIIDDAYNANPASVRASFGAFMQWQAAAAHEGPRVAVLGELRELGADARGAHMACAADVARHPELTELVVVGPFAEDMAQAAREVADLRVIAAPDAEAAAAHLSQHARAVVFLKGSRGARLERVIGLLRDRLAGSDDIG